MIELSKKIAELAYPIAIGGFSGFSRYLYTYSKGQVKFTITGLMVSIVLGSYVALLIGMMLPEAFPFRDGILGMSGFSPLAILGLIEKKGPKIIKKFLDSIK